MKALAEQMSVYHRYHTKTITRLTHFIGVPMIVFAVVLALGWISIDIPGIINARLSWVAFVLVSLYYLYLDVIIASPLIVVLLMMTILANIFSDGGPTWSSFRLFLIFFVGGWIFQFIGHVFEQKKAAFMDNPFQLIIAPIFLTAEIFFSLGLKKELEMEIQKRIDAEDLLDD